ncbi:MAG: MobP3 family relaxase [Eubacteriales bacterium]|nr:MobP3 family relaxase [Eubacteriales bacterium]
MAKIILKSPYLKPNAVKHLANYTRYIAKRDGVEMPDDSKKFLKATANQQKFIAELLAAYPDSRELYEFEDYSRNITRENADEFILRVAETHGELFGNRQNYVSYIATRPRAEKIAEHGLFTDDGVPVVLAQAVKEVSEHTGNVWTHIISLRREDARRLGYDTVDQWQALLRSQRNMIARQMKIKPGNFQWYAAFHNESHHPHIHMMVFSSDPKEPYLTEQGIRTIKSELAKEIFRQDNISIYQKQTGYRDALRKEGTEIIADIIRRTNGGENIDPAIGEMLCKLYDRLQNTNGKKVYGYLKPDVKAIVNGIVDELEKDENIRRLYDLWYEQYFNVIRNYTDTMPEKLHLSENKEFKSIKNSIIQEALTFSDERFTFEDEQISDDIPPIEPSYTEAENAEPIPLKSDTEFSEQETPASDPEYFRLLSQAEKGNRYAQYGLAKLLLDRESERYDPGVAVDWLIESAQKGYTVAQYRIGKMYLRGEHVPKDVMYAFRWLEAAEKKNNQYAQYLLGKTYLSGSDVPQNIEKAVDLLTKSANQGNRYAAYTLGKAYIDGRDIPKNIDKALELLTLSADKGFEAAEYFLGKLLCSGDQVPKDIPKAIDYLTKAAAKGNQFAQYLLGKLYLAGEDVSKDSAQAIHWFSKSAEQGNMYAEYALGKLYLYGRDAERDYEKAIALLTASAGHGNPYAAYLLQNIRKNKNWSFALGSLRLLMQLGRIFYNRLEDERKGKIGLVDKKLRSQIDAKKAAQGIRQE